MSKIGIEVQRLFRKKKHGMEVVAMELINELKEMHSSYNYVVFAKDDEDKKSFSNTENISFKTLKGRTYLDWEQFSLPKAAKKERIDFLHSTCNTSALRLKVPLLITLHDIIYLEELNFKGTTYQNFGNLYRKFVVPTVVKKSRYIITVSNFEKDVIIKKLNVPEDKIKVVYNAVNKKFNNNYTESLLQDFKRKYHLPGQFVLFLGNTAPKKNTNNVIDAYIKYCDNFSEPIPMVILDYDENLLKVKLTKNNRLGLLKNFIFPGFIASNEMPLMYNAATLFLYPSLRESFGLPILEAMACGTPVITSNISSMPEVAGGAALFVDPYSTINIAEQIAEALTNSALQKDLIQKGVVRAAEFTWKKSAENLLSIYNLM